MAYLNCNIPPLKILVKKEYLYDFCKGHGELQSGIFVSAKSLPGTATTFQVLLDNGVLRDKLPVDAFVHKEEIRGVPYSLDHLQIWNSPSYSISCHQFNFLTGLRVDVLMKNKKWEKGELLWTFDWSGECNSGADVNLAEHPDEHKCGHFIALDNGQYAIQPNNRIRFYESSFVTKPFPERPDYKVCSALYNVEQADKWVCEDSDKWMYDVNPRPHPVGHYTHLSNPKLK